MLHLFYLCNHVSPPGTYSVTSTSLLLTVKLHFQTHNSPDSKSLLMFSPLWSVAKPWKQLSLTAKVHHMYENILVDLTMTRKNAYRTTEAEYKVSVFMCERDMYLVQSHDYIFV